MAFSRMMRRIATAALGVGKFIIVIYAVPILLAIALMVEFTRMRKKWKPEDWEDVP